MVFDTAADDDPVDQLPLARLLREQSAEQHDHDHAQAVSVALEGPVAPGALVELLEDPPRGAYRLKGRVRVHGSRGRSGFAATLLGSTSQGVLAHALCPVRVVRVPRRKKAAKS